MGGGTGTSTSTSTGTGQQQLPSWLTGAFGGQATSPPPPPPPATPSTPGFTPAGQAPGQQGNLGFSAAGSQNWNPMSMMMWQLMNGGMQQPSGSGGLYGGVAGGMPDWLKMFGQGGGQAAPAEGTPPPGNYMTGARDTAGYQNNLFDPSQMLPKVVAPTPAAPAAAAPQKTMDQYWAPRYGQEPTITPQQKLQIQGGTYGSYTQANDPAINNWIRWNLGEQGYQNWQQQNARKKASEYAYASGAANREGYMDPYQTNQGINYGYIGPDADLTKGYR